jgi:predicted O-linked N-acetylglucosamine transferase (SPINDLY family)
MKKTSTTFEQLVLQSWAGELGLVQLLEHGNRLGESGQGPLAIVLYQTWLQRNHTTHDHLVLFNLGVLQFSHGDFQGAMASYSKALALSPSFLQPRFNLGLTMERIGNSEAAIAHWLRIEADARSDDPETRPFLLMALNNLGRHYEDKGRLAEALAALDRSLALEPHQPDVLHHWVFLRAKQCVWPVYSPPRGLDTDTLRRCTSTLAMISLSEDPSEQLAAARQYVTEKLNLKVPHLAPKRPYGHKKLRIAYCSSDFCLHPVAMLTVELFELHDRDRFEVYGFDWSREDGSGLRQRVIDAFDHFERIHHLSDEQAAHLIRSHEIDILIDLQGQTLGARANMLAYRPAPVQITYLGLPATTGLPFIDHVVADHYLIPEGCQSYYSEKPLYMPDVYQVCDRKRQIAAPPTRAECGLPATGFVYCCFNNNYKITPEVFQLWMNILRRTPGSVLWLLADNPWAQSNLQQQAMGAGIAVERLVFATRTAPDMYLARLGTADLFLDTYPFNAGTTANDALFAGLPVLTRPGKTFASRMASALLTSAGLPELISETPQAYEERAVELASRPQELSAFRQKLALAKAGGALFDTPRFVRNFEALLLSQWG